MATPRVTGANHEGLCDGGSPAAGGVLAVSLLQHYRQRNAVDTPIYADLRQIEFEHRSSRLSGPLFLLGSGPAGDVIGMPSKDTHFPNAWLSADKTQPNGSVYLVPRDTELSAPLP